MSALEPKVTIGLPVRNGQSHVAEAIESILAQTYINWELILSDNSSTDDTEIICRRYAAREPRIRYYRQLDNVGAAANFNRTLELATGQYFKWAAHDDALEPTWLQRCVNALEADPGAVLCQSLVTVVDERGQCLETYNHAAFGTGHARQSARLAARLEARRCMDVFGLIRTEVLRESAQIASHLGADRTLLVELALRGRFALVPEYLFRNRSHAERFTRRVRGAADQLAWYDPRKAGQRALRTWTLYATCLKLIRRDVPERAERLRCYLHLVRSLRLYRRWFDLAFEPVVALVPAAARIEPALLALAQRVRHALGRRGPVDVKAAP
ncbi:MAG: glycosyltransferase family 2 protein [Geminicoccaceae bacterium]